MDRPWHAKLHLHRDVTLYDILYEYLGVRLGPVRVKKPDENPLSTYYTKKVDELQERIEEISKMSAHAIRSVARHELLPGVANIKGRYDDEVLAEYEMVIAALKTLLKKKTPLTSSIGYQVASMERVVTLFRECVPEASFDADAWKQAKLSTLHDSLAAAKIEVAREQQSIVESRTWYETTTKAIPDKLIRPRQGF